MGNKFERISMNIIGDILKIVNLCKLGWQVERAFLKEVEHYILGYNILMRVSNGYQTYAYAFVPVDLEIAKTVFVFSTAVQIVDTEIS